MFFCYNAIPMSRPPEPVLVIGGGAAGLIAAWRLGFHHVPTILLERNRKLGIKILISGGGKCNVTHVGSIDEILGVFRPREARFLKPALHRFSNDDVVALMHTQGVRTYERTNGRVFPQGATAREVLSAFERLVRQGGVSIRLNAHIEQLRIEQNAVKGVVLGQEFISAEHVVLATGGVSYPQTGTTGDGIRWADRAGHTIVPLRPALAPISIDPPLPATGQGIALRGGRLSVLSGGREIASWSDDILFTHEGVSGPAALEVSRSAAEAVEQGEVQLRFDFFPEEDFADLDARLSALVRENSGRLLENILEPLLPNRLIGDLLCSIQVDPGTRGSTLTREDRRKVTHLLKGWTLGTVAKIDMRRGEVSAGGVSLNEVDPHSMRSRKIHGLYLCGEMLDIAGPVGGYNLQAAFSTGYVAGEAAAADWKGNLAGKERVIGVP